MRVPLAAPSRRHRPSAQAARRGTTKLPLAVALAVAEALLGAVCGDDDTGAYCCDCVCCGASVHLTRDDQSWPECDSPCRRSCEEELGCHPMVESAVDCDPPE